MKKIALAALAAFSLLLPACAGGDQTACEEALAAFDTALDTCGDTTSTVDPWFNATACEGANDDGYDNTAFYTCLTDRLTQDDPLAVCTLDGAGAATMDVRDFEDETGEGGDDLDAGCYDLYNATSTS